MSARAFPPDALRAAIAESVPAHAIEFGGQPPELRFIYLPRAHVRALHPDTMLVRGIRGAGKTLWWCTLQSAAHRKLLAHVLEQGWLDGHMDVSPGFGSSRDPTKYPGKESLLALLATHEPRRIWRAIVLHLLTGADAALGSTWEERVGWVEAHPDESDEWLFRIDTDLRARGRRHLIVFDALDQTADRWVDLHRMLKGLLEILLELRSYRAIRAKAFVRPDMLLAPEVRSFPDASKVLASDVRLSWPRADLYALLWQHLANAERGGEFFRWECTSSFGQSFGRSGGTWAMPDGLRLDEEMQREIFHSITGPYMGDTPKRGQPYLWLPNRLADTEGQVSPRSFLAAIRAAADETPGAGEYALHHEALRAGALKGSQVRVDEIGTDHPWIHVVMKPLRGLVVPCDRADLEQRWVEDRTLALLEKAPEHMRPSRLDEGHTGLCKELSDLAVLEMMSDGRVNMADVYRVGFALRRRGGVRLVR